MSTHLFTFTGFTCFMRTMPVIDTKFMDTQCYNLGDAILECPASFVCKMMIYGFTLRFFFLVQKLSGYYSNTFMPAIRKFANN